jgi:hypothetical protein
MPARGSAKLLKKREFAKKDLEELWTTIDEHEVMEALNWETKGTPAIDQVFGLVKVPRKSVGEAVGTLAQLEQLGLHLHVFPIGVPKPEEMLISFKSGAPGA